VYETISQDIEKELRNLRCKDQEAEDFVKNVLTILEVLFQKKS